MLPDLQRLLYQVQQSREGMTAGTALLLGSLGFTLFCLLTQSSACGRKMVIGSLVSGPSGEVSWQVLGRDEGEVALL